MLHHAQPPTLPCSDPPDLRVVPISPLPPLGGGRCRRQRGARPNASRPDRNGSSRTPARCRKTATGREGRITGPYAPLLPPRRSCKTAALPLRRQGAEGAPHPRSLASRPSACEHMRGSLNMATPNFANRTLYHGDNLPFLRGINSGTIHLIATDPPFNKGRDFHVTPDSSAAGARFEDEAEADHQSARPHAQPRRAARHPDRRARDGLRRLRPRVRRPALPPAGPQDAALRRRPQPHLQPDALMWPMQPHQLERSGVASVARGESTAGSHGDAWHLIVASFKFADHRKTR